MSTTMTQPSATRPRRQQNGVSLIEVLVAVLVIALGILSMLAMQLNATKLTKTSEIRTMGAMLASDLADRMRANKNGFKNNNYLLQTQYNPTAAFTADTTKATQCNHSQTDCSSQSLAAADLADWLNSVHQAMPNGSAWISSYQSVDSAVDVWLVWTDPQERNTSDRNTTECPSNLVATGVTATPRCMYFHINVNP
jgi:type IV pilus assembly protein PilV